MGDVAMPLVRRPVPSFGAVPAGWAWRALVDYGAPAVLADGTTRP